MRRWFQRLFHLFPRIEMQVHNVVVSGWAHRSTVSKDELQHYAKDAGKSAQDVAAITKDEQQLTFMADGVLVQD